MTRLLCRLFGHRWGGWTDASKEVGPPTYQPLFEYRECQRCPEVQVRDVL